MSKNKMSNKAEAEAMANVKAGLVPGVEPRDISDEESEQAFLEEMSVSEDRLCFMEFDRDQMNSGVEFGDFLMRLPDSARGQVVLSFSGWADDPRELYDIPEVIACCEAIVSGKDLSIDARRSRTANILAVLCDESRFEPSMGPVAYEVAGRLWLVTLLFQKACLIRSGATVSRSIPEARKICEHLMKYTSSPRVATS